MVRKLLALVFAWLLIFSCPAFPQSVVGGKAKVGGAAAVGGGPGAGSVPTFVRAAPIGYCPPFGCSITTVATTFAANNTAGDALTGIVFFQSATGGISSVSDGGAGGTASLCTAIFVDATDGYSAQAFTIRGITGGSNATVTVTMGASQPFMMLGVVETTAQASGCENTAQGTGWQGVGPTGFIGSGNPIAIGSMTPSSAGYVLAMYADINGTNGGTLTATTPFTVRVATLSGDNPNNRSVTVTDFGQSTSGAVNPTATDSTGFNGMGFAATFH